MKFDFCINPPKMPVIARKFILKNKYAISEAIPASKNTPSPTNTNIK